MKYEVTFINPTRTNPMCVDTFNGKANAREFINRGRQYPGSFELVSVVKISPKGVRTYVDM